jgi:tetratricopeptide (TPR) repeat protein
LELIDDKNDNLYLPTLYHLGINQHRNKLLREAIQSLTLILENESYDKCVYEARGKVYLELDRCEEALKDFERVSEIEDHYPDIYFYKGLAKNNLDKTDEAIEDFFHALELGSRNVGVYNGIGQTYLKAKKYEKALYYSNIALEKSPNN